MANRVDPDQTVSPEADFFGKALFAIGPVKIVYETLYELTYA